MSGSRKTNRAGGKFSGSHTTTFPDAGAVLDALDACEQVTKIVLSIIINDAKTAGRPLRVKVLNERIPDTCLRVTVVKGGLSQIVYVYVRKPEQRDTVRSLVEEFTDEKVGKRGKKVRGRRKKGLATDDDWNNRGI